MRINKFIANAVGIGRRAADKAIAESRVQVNGTPAQPGQDIADTDEVTLDGSKLISSKTAIQTIMLNKPAGYVVSRNGQGSRTVYDLLPKEYQHLKPVGRLDKDSSGLLLLTNDGQLAFDLTHPSKHKQKIYEVTLDKPLTHESKARIQRGVQLDDGISRLDVRALRLEARKGNGSTVKHPTSNAYLVTMHEGRNRQIRRTFAALGYTVTTLHRTQSGKYLLEQLPPGNYVVTSGTG